MSARGPTIVGVLIVLFFLFPSSILADIRINEFSPQANPEWVELYNPDVDERSLSGMVLYFADTIDTTQKVTFCGNTTLAGKTYARIIRPEGSYWLSNSGDTLILKREDDVIDSITFGNQLLKAPVGSQSATRKDTGEWIITDTSSPMGDQINFVCPTATPTNTPIPTTTITPTATSAPTRTPTPTVAPTISPTSTPSGMVIEENIESSEGGIILGKQTANDNSSIIQSGLSLQKRPYITALLAVGVVLALIAALYVVKITIYSK